MLNVVTAKSSCQSADWHEVSHYWNMRVPRESDTAATDHAVAESSCFYGRVTKFSMKNSIIRGSDRPVCPWSGPTWTSKLLPSFCRARMRASELDGWTLSSAVPK